MGAAPKLCKKKSTLKCPPKPCRPVCYCGRGPGDVVCTIHEDKPRSTFRCYGPCPATRCCCPDIWPTLLPKVKCCIKRPRTEDPLACPVLPTCRPPRFLPEPCKPKLVQEQPPKPNPPILPPCFPCRPLMPPPRSYRRVRCLDPVLPCCPPPCRMPPPPPRQPEPPYPPFCPVFPACNCPDVPLIVHNSCRYFRPTEFCDKANDRTNPNVCFVPVDRRDIAQISCDLGVCECW